MNISVLQKIRYSYKVNVPEIMKASISKIKAKESKRISSGTFDEIKTLFPDMWDAPIVEFTKGNNAKQKSKALRFGVILSGGQAPGGHNVIAGIFDALKKWNQQSRLYGFLGGPAGLVNGQYIEIKKPLIDAYRNTGGFDIIGSGRTKIETKEQVEDAISISKKLKLDALVIIGGDDSNTNAAMLAKFFAGAKLETKVVGVPKTIDGDLKNEFIETSFGFDTATKTYAELIGNICRDVNSSRKYWHFIKLMGRSASHIALECALQTHPNICLIGEEVAAKKMTLSEIVNPIADLVAKRAADEKNFGVVLVPEGLIEFIPEMKMLIQELNDLLAKHAVLFSNAKSFDEMKNLLCDKLSPASFTLFSSLPQFVAMQLLMDRDPHGNVQVSKIETERLLISLIEKRLSEMRANGGYAGAFNPLSHFFGYEGRSAFPSNFDADYCYALGFTAFLLALHGYSGYIASVKNLTAKHAKWILRGVPLPAMIHLEKRKGIMKPVIKKALVDLKGKPFQTFVKLRKSWAEKDDYVFPGAIQYFGESELCDATTKTLKLEYAAAKEKPHAKKTGEKSKSEKSVFGKKNAKH